MYTKVPVDCDVLLIDRYSVIHQLLLSSYHLFHGIVFMVLVLAPFIAHLSDAVMIILVSKVNVSVHNPGSFLCQDNILCKLDRHVVILTYVGWLCSDIDNVNRAE